MRHAPSWFIELCRPVVYLLARLLFRVRFHGAEHVPRSGPVVLVPNHVSYMDPVLITLPIHRPLHYMTLDLYLHVPGLGPLIRWCRAFGVREDVADGPAVRHAIRLLRAGEALVVFPEGGRSRDGRLGTLRAGAFRISLAANAPVVPVTIAGAFEAWPVHRRLPRPGRIAVTYHTPVSRNDLPATADRRALPELLAAVVRDRIASALGPAGSPAPAGARVTPAPPA